MGMSGRKLQVDVVLLHQCEPLQLCLHLIDLCAFSANPAMAG